MNPGCGRVNEGFLGQYVRCNHPFICLRRLLSCPSPSLRFHLFRLSRSGVLPLTFRGKMSPVVKIEQEILVLPSFTLECGETLRDVPVAYKTWGKLNEQRDNVMIICHAFTGSSDVEDW